MSDTLACFLCDVNALLIGRGWNADRLRRPPAIRSFEFAAHFGFYLFARLAVSSIRELLEGIDTRIIEVRQVFRGDGKRASGDAVYEKRSDARAIREILEILRRESRRELFLQE